MSVSGDKRQEDIDAKQCATLTISAPTSGFSSEFALAALIQAPFLNHSRLTGYISMNNGY